MKLHCGITPLALTMGIVIAPPCLGLSVSEDNVGQVLLYPYYTANGGNQTVLSVVNTTPRTKAVLVRFREGRNSREVLKFNLYLSSYDAWTGAIVAMGDAGPATLYSTDSSCTVPALPRAGVPFRADKYTGAHRDHPSAVARLDAIERTREGHLEVIELGELQAGNLPTQLADEVALHLHGLPTNCATVVAAWNPALPGAWANAGQLNINLPTGGLYGSASIVDVADGTMLAYDAVALERFYTNAARPGELHRTSVLDDDTNLMSADNGAGIVKVRLPEQQSHEAVEEVLSTALRTPDAVSLTLMQSSSIGEYTFDETLGAATEWIVSFPTKSYYTDFTTTENVKAPFTSVFQDDGAACETIYLQFNDRNGLRQRDPFETVGGTPPPAPPNPMVCGTVNVISFGQWARYSSTSAILGARVEYVFPTYFPYFGFSSAGFAELIFDNPDTTAPDNRWIAPGTFHGYAGLPAIGLTVLRFENSQARPGILASYGGAYRHRPIRTPLDP